MRNFLDNRPKIPTPNTQHSQSNPHTLPTQGLNKILPSSSIIHQTDTSHSEFPRIELSQDSEGRISEIRLHCRCGEMITLRCIY
ncbi:MAG: hypothetical protein N2035_04980 [Chthoniobacterales bacterium]|nr:hypothetical protein [Chthoniobacterales bacterium]